MMLQPYPGLRPFQKHEWPIFFGREEMIEAVLNRLAAAHLVVVHGASGCGKSSLIRAGVLPRLEREYARYGLPWRTAEMRPGSSPLWNLATAIARMVEKLKPDDAPTLANIRTIRRFLNGGNGALRHIQERFELGRDNNVCILLDQFEELFRYAREVGHEEAEALIEVLRGFERSNDGRDALKGIYAILTLRSDHLGDCGNFQGFAELVNTTQYLLPRIRDEALLRAIREPARLFGGEISVDLAVRLVDESRAKPDALPLIQHALMRFWGASRPTHDALRSQLNPTSAPIPIINADTYVRLEEILSEHAEEVLQEISIEHPGGEILTEFLFRAITQVDADGQIVRRPQHFSELVAVTGNDEAALRSVISRFSRRDCGFLACSTGSDPIIDIAHEALIRCWRKLGNYSIHKGIGSGQGWLQHEWEDERTWRAMLVQAEACDVISSAVLKERELWFASLPSPAWAKRYGGGGEKIAKLLKLSRNAARRKRLVQVGAGFFVLFFAAVVSWWAMGVSTKDGLIMSGLQLGLINPAPEMVLLKGGTFVMGSTSLTSKERPVHTVQIDPFEISKYEVTFDDWNICVLDGGCQGYQPNDEGWGRGRRPVTNVSWKDAKEYVKWLSEETGESYRLPSEAEWEYAARAGTTTEYFWGNKITPANANYDNNVNKTTEVGSYPANPWGLHDMNGNVYEWVEDCWNDSYKGAPSDGSAWEKSGNNCPRRALRGGAWMSFPGKLISAHRGFYDAANRQYAFGFRVAKDTLAQ